jgi:hypothetical protein
MALNNLSNLRAAVRQWAHRDDDLSNTLIDDFVLITEDKIQKSLKLRNNEARSQATLLEGDRFLALPNRFLQMRSIRILEPDCTIPLEYQPIANMKIIDWAGMPLFFSVTSELVFDRVAGKDYTLEMDYYVGLVGLTDANPTNNVLADHPRLYLYGCLAEVFSWAQDDEQSVKFIALFEAALSEANREENRGRYGPVPRMVSTRPTP